MELTDLLALLGLVVGVAYLVLAVVAFNRSRHRHSEHDADRSGSDSVVLNLVANPMVSDGEPTPVRMRKLAGVCVATSRRAFGEDFDYSMESITRLDRAIVKGWGDSDTEVSNEVVLSFGAYLGEVLVRRTRGRWVSGMTDLEPAAVLFLGADENDVVSFSPFMLVREKFNNMFKFDLSIAVTALEQKLKEGRAA
jgi:hypothetical protein